MTSVRVPEVLESGVSGPVPSPRFLNLPFTSLTLRLAWFTRDSYFYSEVSERCSSPISDFVLSKKTRIRESLPYGEYLPVASNSTFPS